MSVLKMLGKTMLVLFLCTVSLMSYAQLVINGGTVTIESGAFISVQGNVSTNTDILGAGKLLMNGSSNQQLNTNGFIIPNLEIANSTNISLAGNSKVSNSLIFTSGKIQTGNYSFILAAGALVTGAGTSKFIETNGSGSAQRDITTAGSYLLPVGAGVNYMPLQYDVAGGAIAPGAYVGTQLNNGAHPGKPVRATDFLTAYWKPLYGGITGATMNAVGTYADAGSITGTESLLNGMRYDGSDWSMQNSTINTVGNTVTYNNITTGVDLYAMDKFVLMNAKVFLQGAFGGAVMTDNLRAANLIPTSDPYRTAPYSANFTHANNLEAETINAGVLADFGNNNNIVDWVFVELRNAGGSLIQTRSALLQKDGDVVDVDGVNPVFFKNVDATNYVITIRHRNHLGLSADLTNAKSLSLARPAIANTFDFTTASDAEIFGDGSAYFTSGAFKMLWGGNANSNGSTRYSGPSNDHSYLLSTELAGNGSDVISGVYRSGDLNLNGVVRYSGPANDHTFLLGNVLGGNGSNVINQQIITP